MALAGLVALVALPVSLLAPLLACLASLLACLALLVALLVAVVFALLLVVLTRFLALPTRLLVGRAAMSEAFARSAPVASGRMREPLTDWRGCLCVGRRAACLGSAVWRRAPLRLCWMQMSRPMAQTHSRAFASVLRNGPAVVSFASVASVVSVVSVLSPGLSRRFQRPILVLSPCFFGLLSSSFQGPFSLFLSPSRAVVLLCCGSTNAAGSDYYLYLLAFPLHCLPPPLPSYSAACGHPSPSLWFARCLRLLSLLSSCPGPLCLLVVAVRLPEPAQAPRAASSPLPAVSSTFFLSSPNPLWPFFGPLPRLRIRLSSFFIFVLALACPLLLLVGPLAPFRWTAFFPLFGEGMTLQPQLMRS